MIAAEHDRDPALFHDGERGLIEPLAYSRDLADVFLARITERLDLRDRGDQVARVGDGQAQGGEPLAEAGNAERRGTHVHAAPIASEVERNADDVNRAGHGPRIPSGGCQRDLTT